ncbi:MAG TPA: ester cyclase [Acidimicrobiia bacterium]|nr:ester cyclase [Acidimicrobiia bacterium]
MTAEQNKELIVRLLGAMNAGDTKTIKENLTENFVRHDMVEVFSRFFGKDGAGDFLEALHTGLPDLRVDIDDIFASEDRVAVRETNRGTHTGPLLGIEPTGRRIEFSGINIYRIENGRVAETWQHIDWHGALRQLAADTL